MRERGARPWAFSILTMFGLTTCFAAIAWISSLWPGQETAAFGRLSLAFATLLALLDLAGLPRRREPEVGKRVLACNIGVLCFVSAICGLSLLGMLSDQAARLLAWAMLAPYVFAIRWVVLAGERSNANRVGG